MKMRTIATVFSILIIAATMALAQSSGSFNFNSAETACTDTSGLLGTGVSVPALKTTLKVSSGADNVLVINGSGFITVRQIETRPRSSVLLERNSKPI